MEPDARYTLVGAVVIALAIGIAFGAMWLKHSSSEEDIARYTVIFKKHLLSGLQPDGDVTMRGIRIGKVESVRILPRSDEGVRVVVAIGRDTPVKSDSQAVIRRNMLTGLAGIDIIPGSPNASPPFRVDQVGGYAEIPEGNAAIDQLANTIPGAIDNFNDAVSKFALLLSTENQEHVSGILGDVKTITGSLAQSVQEKGTDVGSLLNNANALLKEARVAVEHIDQNSSQVSSSFASLAQTFSLQMAEMARTVMTTGRSLKATAERLESPRKVILGPDPKTLGPGEK